MPPTTPPPLPNAVLRRVLAVARFDGWSFALVSGVLAVWAAVSRDFLGAFVGALVCAGGIGELTGARRLARGDIRGTSWLVGSQLFILASILGYFAFRLTHVDLTPLHALFREMMKNPAFRAVWSNYEDIGVTEDWLLSTTYQLSCIVIPFVTLIYQGGLAVFYARRREVLKKALP